MVKCVYTCIALIIHLSFENKHILILRLLIKYHKKVAFKANL